MKKGRTMWRKVKLSMYKIRDMDSLGRFDVAYAYLLLASSFAVVGSCIIYVVLYLDGGC